MIESTYYGSMPPLIDANKMRMLHMVDTSCRANLYRFATCVY